jgi:hypothetical protein
MDHFVKDLALKWFAQAENNTGMSEAIYYQNFCEFMVLDCTIYPIETPVKADGINRNSWPKGSDQSPKYQQSERKHILRGKC